MHKDYIKKKLRSHGPTTSPPPSASSPPPPRRFPRPSPCSFSSSLISASPPPPPRQNSQDPNPSPPPNTKPRWNWRTEEDESSQVGRCSSHSPKDKTLIKQNENKLLPEMGEGSTSPRYPSRMTRSGPEVGI